MSKITYFMNKDRSVIPRNQSKHGGLSMRHVEPMKTQSSRSTSVNGNWVTRSSIMCMQLLCGFTTSVNYTGLRAYDKLHTRPATASEIADVIRHTFRREKSGVFISIDDVHINSK